MDLRVFLQMLRERHRVVVLSLDAQDQRAQTALEHVARVGIHRAA